MAGETIGDFWYLSLALDLLFALDLPRMSHFEIPDASFTRWLAVILMALTLLIAIGLVADDSQGKFDSKVVIEDSLVVTEEPTLVDQLADGEVAATTPIPTKGFLSGERIYSKACAVCHTTGVGGAPIYGNAVAWNSRIEQNIKILYEHAINGFTGGFGYMPPKGGFITLGDDEVIAAVDYMLEAI
ncbi:MAG: c-type cytochrome [Arenicellaceae bacterium]|nr:c-type cytochrome [Arenicellaceae bacterium]